MDDSELEKIPNPFSAFADSRANSRRNFAAAAKFFLGTIAIFCIVILSQAYLHRSRLAEIVEGFSVQTTAEKMDHLHHLRASGAAGIPGLVAAVVDDHPRVSATAFEIISDLHRDWMTLPTDRLSENRLVFAEALINHSEQITDNADPRWHRIQSLAGSLAQELLASTGDENAAAYKSLVNIISVGSSNRQAQAGQETTAAAPLPIDTVDSVASSWTDWPPTSSTPKLYRRGVATIDSMGTSDVVLRQTDRLNQTDSSEARLLKPTVRPASTLADLPRQVENEQSTSYWIAQLDSFSRLVRKRAVTELCKRGDQQTLDALRDHLKSESDHTIALLIRKRLAL